MINDVQHRAMIKKFITGLVGYFLINFTFLKQKLKLFNFDRSEFFQKLQMKTVFSSSTGPIKKYM